MVAYLYKTKCIYDIVYIVTYLHKTKCIYIYNCMYIITYSRIEILSLTYMVPHSSLILLSISIFILLNNMDMNSEIIIRKSKLFFEKVLKQ